MAADTGFQTICPPVRLNLRNVVQGPCCHLVVDNGQLVLYWKPVVPVALQAMAQVQGNA
jgi:hypothetical protein